jgi:hypothetical protein
MRLLNTIRLLVKPDAPTTGVAQGALYYDSTREQTRVHDAIAWKDASPLGVPNPVTGVVYICDGREVTYFDRLVNDGVLTIEGTGTLIGVR